MSQWNLSVQLTGQGSDLAATLRDSAKEAGKLTDRVNDAKRALAELRAEAANPINIRLDVDGDHLRRDVDSALTTAGSGQGITVRLDIDGAHLRDDVQAALTAASSGQSTRVRLDIDAAHLRDDVTAALTDAGTGQGITVRLNVDGDHLRDDVNAALTTAGTGQGITVRLNVDADHLRADVNAALTAAGAGQGMGIRLTLADSMQLRRDVQAAVRWAAMGQRIEIPLVLADSMQLRRDVSAAVRWAAMGQTIRVRVVADTSGLVIPTPTPSPTRGGGGSGSDKDLMGQLKGLLLLAPAAIPLAAGLTANLTPLAAQFGAAGIGATAFGIALAGQIGPLSDAADAEKKYKDAVAQHGASSKEAMEASLAYQKQLSQLPPETQRAAISLSTLKTNFTGWSDSMSRFTMQPVTKGITILDTLIPHLTPEVKSASLQLNRLADVAGGAISTPGFDALSKRIASFTDSKLDQLTDQVIHFMRVISEGGTNTGAIGAILDYARENGPAAKEALSAISKAVIVLVQGAAQAGPGMLTLITAASQLVAALPPELVGIILGVATALKILQLSGAGMAALAGGIARVRTAIAALATTSAAAGGGLAGLRAAFLSLGVAAKTSVVVAGIAAVVLVLSKLSNIGKATPPNVERLTTALGNLGRTGKVTGEAAAKFGTHFETLKSQMDKVLNPSVAESVNNWGHSISGGLLKSGDATEELKGSFKAIDQSLSDMVKGGNAKLAAAALKNMLRTMRPDQAKKLQESIDKYKSSLADQALEQKLAAESMGLFGKAAQDTQAKLDAQKSAADGLRQSIVALNDVNRAGLGGMIAFEASIDSAAKAAKENAGSLRMVNGVLDTNSPKAQAAASALQDLADKTDAAATANRESTGSWEGAIGIYDRGRAELIKNAQAMGLTKDQAAALASQILKIPDKKTRIRMESEDATRDLNAFNSAVRKSPGSKSVTLKTLSAGAEKVLEGFGFRVKRLPNGKVTVTAKTGAALSAIGGIKAAVDGLHSKSIGIGIYKTTYLNTVRTGTAIDGKKYPGVTPNARGSVLDFYANGGIRPGEVRYYAAGSDPDDKPNRHRAQLVPAGSYRVFGERETDGEGYVPFRRSARPRSRKITEEIVRRLGGDPAGIQWNANGSVTDWRYDPTTGSLYSASDAGSVGHKTKKVKVKVKGKTVTKDVEYFDITAVEKKIKSASKATTAWNKDLEKVADRVGGDVADALAAMGADGEKLAHKMATGSTKYINDMAAALRNLQKTAKASLTDYTRQLSKANTLNKTFSDNLAKLASQGYGDLASQLAAQNDKSAQDLAAAAVKDKGKASSANAAAKTANNALTADQVAELVSIIAAIKTSKTGIHDVAGTTALGEDEIITVANKAKTQISSSLGSRATKFLADLSRANSHLSYANGGIRPGIYATQGGAVTFAEPSTGGEAYLPLGTNKRRHAMPVLADVAHRFGVGLTDVNSGRPVVIIRSGDTITIPVTAVRTGATASDIGSQVGRSWRRARRGGVAARAES